MYLLENNENSSIGTKPKELEVIRLRSSAPFDQTGPGWIHNSWFIYTVIGASFLLTLIAFAIIYDICHRCHEFREQHILDGGPPASPGHQFKYTFGIRVDEASLSFDTKQAIIKMDLLDVKNRYLTSVAIPCFVFKFKRANQIKSSQSTSNYPTPFTNINNNNYNSGNNNLNHNSKNPLNYRSLTGYRESWSNTPKASIIVFHLIRRNPLKDFASIRILHDCFKPNAYITLKYVIIRDDLSKQSAKVDLVGKQIFASHPCPPSGFQVFGAFKVV